VAKDELSPGREERPAAALAPDERRALELDALRPVDEEVVDDAVRDEPGADEPHRRPGAAPAPHEQPHQGPSAAVVDEPAVLEQDAAVRSGCDRDRQDRLLRRVGDPRPRDHASAEHEPVGHGRVDRRALGAVQDDVLEDEAAADPEPAGTPSPGFGGLLSPNGSGSLPWCGFWSRTVEPTGSILL